MFFIALVCFHSVSSLELSTFINKLQKVDTFEEEMCYYDLKVDLIIKNYVEKVKELVEEAMIKHEVTEITFEFFTTVFKEGNYGQIAYDLGESEDYVKSYWNYFSSETTTIMTVEQFTKFMGLYYLEGELLVEDIHPTLTLFFKNEHNVSKGVGCKVALAFWMLTESMLQKIFVTFEWSTDDKSITKHEIFDIISQTHSGKCWLIMDSDCSLFSGIVGKIQGFFNLSNGSRVALDIPETKIAYTTLVFNDLYNPPCDQTKFDEAEIKEKISKLAV